MKRPKVKPRGLCDYRISDDWADTAASFQMENGPQDQSAAEAEFGAAFDRLVGGFETYDPGAVLATFGMPGAASALEHSQRRIELAHVELATAFALHFPSRGETPTAGVMRGMADALETYMDLYPRFALSVGDDPKSRSLALRRQNTFRARHTANPIEAIAVFERVINELNTDTTMNLGVAADRALHFIQQSANIIAKRIV